MSNKTMKLVCDIKSIPENMDFGTFVKIYEQHHLVLWDSSRGGVKPKLYANDEVEAKLLIVDTAGKEIDIEFYTKEFKEVEFWKKELYSCKKSPIYFFKNYGTTIWPNTDTDLAAFMKNLGIGEVAAKDGEEAEKLWEKQKEQAMKAMEFVNIELLKDRKVVVDILRHDYETTVKALEKLVSTHVRLFDSNNVPLPPNKQVGNVVEKIRKFLPVHLKYSDKYRTKKGKWDSPMLFVTSYNVLLEIYYDVLKDNNRIEELVVGKTEDLGRARV